MADVKWIKITTDIFDDEKILLIETLPEADSIIVIWFKLLTLAGKMNNSGVFILNDTMPYTDAMLATIFRRKETTVKLALKTFEQFGMIEIVNDVITIPNWGKHQNLDQLEQKKNYMREYMRNYREKQKQLSCKTDDINNCKTNSKANVRPVEEDKNKNKNKNKEYIVQIVSYLNEKAGTNYKATTKDTVSHINARLSDGFTVDDFKTVIDKKVNEWQGTEFEKYLRPKTLFGTKFESYLNAKMTVKTCTVERDAQLDEIF